MVPGVESIWIAFDRWEERIQAVGWENRGLKMFPIHIVHNSISIKTHIDKMVVVQ